MDPISLAIGAVGLGMSIFGGMSSAANAGEQAKVSQDEARQEQGINDLKQQAMESDARRQQLEITRQAQRAQSLATSRATSQGAQFGSGLQGGLAQVTDQSAFNMQGINTSLTIGRGINDRNQNISQDKIQMAGLGGAAATDQAISSIGGTLMKVGPTVGAMAKGFGGNNGGFGLGSLFMGGGTPTGLG